MAVQEERSTSSDPHPDSLDQHEIIDSQKDIFLSESDNEFELDTKIESYFYQPGKKGDFLVDCSLTFSTSQETKENDSDCDTEKLHKENDILRKENELLKKENCILKEQVNLLELKLKSNNNSHGNL